MIRGKIRLLKPIVETVARWRQHLMRWKYVVLTHRDYAARLNRSMEVEGVLMACAAGKRDPLSKEECRQLAILLGVPEEFRSSPSQKQFTTKGGLSW